MFVSNAASLKLGRQLGIKIYIQLMSMNYSRFYQSNLILFKS